MEPPRITHCEYTDYSSDCVLIKVKYNTNFEEVLRCVNKKELLIKPSEFIGLKRQEAIELNIVTGNKNKNINPSQLF